MKNQITNVEKLDWKTKKFTNQTMKQLAKCRKCKNKNTKQCDFLKYIEFSGAEI